MFAAGAVGMQLDRYADDLRDAACERLVLGRVTFGNETVWRIPRSDTGRYRPDLLVDRADGVSHGGSNALLASALAVS